MSADGPALLAPAVRAACLAKAPRRTIQAVAAAVTGVLVRPTADAVPRSRPLVPAGAQSAHFDDVTVPGIAVDAIREARRAQRRRKKEKRQAAKRAADVAPTPHDTVWREYVITISNVNDTPAEVGAAGSATDHRGISDDEPARAPQAVSFAASPEQSTTAHANETAASIPPPNDMSRQSGSTRTLGRSSSKAMSVDTSTRKQSMGRDGKSPHSVIKSKGKTR